MTDKSDLLVEIGTEELPPKSLVLLAKSFSEGVAEGLEREGLEFNSVKWFATPRRLAFIVHALDRKQMDREIVRRGPALDAARDNNGNPSKAAMGFAKSCGVESIEELEIIENGKGKWLGKKITEPGKEAALLIPDIVEQVLARLPIARRMRWGTGSVEFVRPVHWTVAMLGDDLIECEILGKHTTRSTRGHRFHHPEAVILENVSEYQDKLENPGKVIADFEQRRNIIRQQLIDTARSVNGTVIIDDDLLDEVTALVEWPVVLMGEFDKSFLVLPGEVLITAMQDYQKYFPVKDRDENLLSCFIAISNIESKNPELVRKGNERVIRPRLGDAEFFWNKDRERALSDYQPELSHVIFQHRLGTLAEKSERVTTLSLYIAGQFNHDKGLVQRAGVLSKCDLMTEMVGEFPGLQGVMGKYYALQSGEPEEVALALDEQYMPRFAGDLLPCTRTGQFLSIADKLDTLVGIFSLGKKPTGEKDPFGLRRAALGCLRIMIECQLDIDLQDCLKQAAIYYRNADIKDGVIEEIFDFMMERLRRYYLDNNISHDIFEAVLSRRPTRPYDFDQRVKAVMQFRELPEAESLTVANKRISNILKQANMEKIISINKKLLQEKAEQDLSAALENAEHKVMPLLRESKYKDALTELANLKQTVDIFFDEVLVMCDDEILKNNRLALLNNLSRLFLETADISRLQN